MSAASGLAQARLQRLRAELNGMSIPPRLQPPARNAGLRIRQVD